MKKKHLGYVLPSTSSLGKNPTAAQTISNRSNNLLDETFSSIGTIAYTHEGENPQSAATGVVKIKPKTSNMFGTRRKTTGTTLPTTSRDEGMELNKFNWGKFDTLLPKSRGGFRGEYRPPTTAALKNNNINNIHLKTDRTISRGIYIYILYYIFREYQ